MRFLGILLLATCVWGQTDGVTTTVSRTIVLPADEARYSLQATVPFTTTLTQVLQALSTLGLQPSDLVGQSATNNNTGVSFPNVAVMNAVYSFSFTRAADTYGDLFIKLEALRRSPPASYIIQYSATLGASNTSIEAMRRSVLPGLLADARAKAVTMASAANLSLGAIRSVSDINDSSLSAGIIGDLGSSSNFRISYSLTVRFSAQ